MSQANAFAIAQNMEQAPTSRDGHTHNFDGAYQQIVQMQHQDGGKDSPQFKQDMHDLNQKLQNDGTLTNLQIVGVDENSHQLVTKDIADNKTTEQNPSAVNDHGALGSGSSGREAADAALANAFGINVTRNGDGSYDVQDPLANGPQAAGSVINALMTAFEGGGSGGDAGSNGPDAPGLNPWLKQALFGSPADQVPQPDADPPDGSDDQ
ncbi:MAG TPA: hypothetical protein V6C81_31530 [Planktothrix sp.]|jgi:hypothetical protein